MIDLDDIYYWHSYDEYWIKGTKPFDDFMSVSVGIDSQPWVMLDQYPYMVHMHTQLYTGTTIR